MPERFYTHLVHHISSKTTEINGELDMGNVERFVPYVRTEGLQPEIDSSSDHSLFYLAKFLFR